MYLFICSHVAYGVISTSSIDVRIVPENVAMTVGDEASGIFLSNAVDVRRQRILLIRTAQCKEKHDPTCESIK